MIPFPDKKYSVIYADPPWSYSGGGAKRNVTRHYHTIVMLNQASTDRIELAKLLNISDTQISYVTNVDAGHGLIKVGSSLIPFSNKFPKNTKLYRLMTTKPGEGA